MKNLKVALIVLLLITGLKADAMQSCDQFGRTELINFVIQAEDEISRSKKELEKIWSTYFYKEKFHDGNIKLKNGVSIPHYKYSPIRKIYTTDADVALYRQKEQEYSKLILQATKQIGQIVRSGVDVNAKDHEGNTAVNYCYTYELYDALCKQGASFQLRSWIYFNPGTSMLIGVPAALMTMAVIGTSLVLANSYQSIQSFHALNKTTNSAH